MLGTSTSANTTERLLGNQTLTGLSALDLTLLLSTIAGVEEVERGFLDFASFECIHNLDPLRYKSQLFPDALTLITRIPLVINNRQS